MFVISSFSDQMLSAIKPDFIWLLYTHEKANMPMFVQW